MIGYLARNKFSKQQVEVENTGTEKLTPYMLAVLREQFDVADLLVHAKLASPGYVNIEGLTVQRIAANLNRVRALQYLSGGSVDSVGAGKARTKRGSESVGAHPAARSKAANLPAHPDQPRHGEGSFASRNPSQPTVKNYQDRSDIFQKSFTRQNNETEAMLRTPAKESYKAS